MINWDAVAKWRDELRSGKYKQGRGQLRNNTDDFCCLGVLCEGVVGMSSTYHQTLGHRYGHSYGITPVEAKVLLGSTKPEGLTIFGAYFANLNDTGKTPAGDPLVSEPLTFDEIADLLDIALIEREGIE